MEFNSWCYPEIKISEDLTVIRLLEFCDKKLFFGLLYILRGKVGVTVCFEQDAVFHRWAPACQDLLFNNWVQFSVSTFYLFVEAKVDE